MGTYPTSPRSAFLTWCQAHTQGWIANAAGIGLTAGQATAFDTATTAAADALGAQEAARLAYRAATDACNDAFGDLRSITGSSVQLIKGFAEQQANPSTVYQLAQIDPPAPPKPMPAPAKPTDLTVSIDPSSGALTLKWKAANPKGSSGTSYIIRRRIPGEPSFTFLGVTGTKTYVDASFIAGPDTVEYTVQGARSGIEGPLSNIFLIRFGASGGDGLLTATVTEQSSDGVKLAA